jgi:serine/threonine protein kinase
MTKARRLDLKPSNIMIDADGEPHIMDFGLAKREAGEITMTTDGQMLGTPKVLKRIAAIYPFFAPA